MFVAAAGLGELLGPFMSSYLTHYYSFTTAYEAYSILVVVYIILYFLLTGGFGMCAAQDQLNQEKNEEM